MAESDSILQASADAVADLIAKVDPGAMATKFVLLAEVIDAEGDRCLWVCAREGQKPWDSLGLLQYGIALEQAATNHDAD